MAFLKNFKFKLFISVLVGLSASLYQMEVKDEYEVTTKLVMLNKNKTYVFDLLTQIDQFQNWFPNVYDVKHVDMDKVMGVGKRFTIQSALIFAFGESNAVVTVTAYQKPTYFEFLVDNWLMERNKLEFKEGEKGSTMVEWSVYSRKKSVLFKHTIGALYQFYYSQLMREALFKLQLRLRGNV